MMFKRCNVSPLIFLAFFGLFIFTSCDKDKDEMNEVAATVDKTRATNTNGADTTDGTETAASMDDDDDCLDHCEEFCFDFIYPVTVVFPDGTTAVANDEDELEMLAEDWYDQNPNSDEDPSLEYPVEVELEDGELLTLNNDDELFELLDECEEGEEDWLDCFEFVYPLSVLLPDGTTVQVDDDEALEMAVEGWYEQNPNSDEDPTLQYPIEVILDGATDPTAIHSDDELEALLEDCWEDDDFEDCFEINFPITVLFPDGTSLAVNDYEELDAAVDGWYDANPNSSEDPTLEFPITVTLEDGTVETVNSEEELDLLFEECYDDCEFNGSNLLIGLQGTATTKAVVKKWN